MIEIRPVASDADLAAVRGLLVEYAASLDFDLEYQGFGAELASLPGAYAPPGGCFLLARVAGDAAGCVAYRSLGPGRCEMKRLFVRPRCRGLGLGRRLALALLEEARRAGLVEMRLDTHPSMKAAQRLYRELGFRETAAYSDTYLPGTRFFVLNLAD